MRNFWINTNVDGRQSDLSSGPRRNDGCMNTQLYVNDNGSSTKALSINCYPNGDELTITTRFFDNHSVTIKANKKEDSLIVQDSFKQALAEILDENIPPSQKIKKIKELL